MRILHAAIIGLLLLVSVTPDPDLRADDSPMADLQGAVYIDPAVFLPDAFGQVVTEPFENIPLSDAVPLIAQLADMPARAVEQHLADDGILLDTPITLRGGLPLYMALDRMCWEAGRWRDSSESELAWVIDRGILSFTTRSAEIDWMMVRTYEVSDLLPRWEQEAQPLIDLIQAHTHIAEWVDLDGIGGEIDQHGNLLVIRQTFAAHRKIAALLTALRTNAKTGFVDRPPVAAAIDAAMIQPIQGSLDGLAIRDVISILSDQTEVEVLSDPIWLLEEPARQDLPMNCPLIGQDLRTTLELMFAAQASDELSYVVRDGAIWISDQSRLDELYETILYRIDDLLIDGNIQSLIDLVQSQTSGEWVDIDGIGGEIDAAPPHTLAITQTRQAHVEIAALFAQLRESFVRPTPADPNEVVIRSYLLPEAMANDLLQIVPQLIEPGSWNDSADPTSSKVGQVHILHYENDTTLLVIQHTRAVHSQFEKFHRELDPMQYWKFLTRWIRARSFGALDRETGTPSEGPQHDVEND